jgi:hypothetical protein
MKEKKTFIVTFLFLISIASNSYFYITLDRNWFYLIVNSIISIIISIIFLIITNRAVSKVFEFLRVLCGIVMVCLICLLGVYILFFYSIYKDGPLI